MILELVTGRVEHFSKWGGGGGLTRVLKLGAEETLLLASLYFFRKQIGGGE